MLFLYKNIHSKQTKNTKNNKLKRLQQVIVI